ncbi:glutaredoxin domain-containing protein [Rothia endophytica]|uniref:glutaredoxin domain-containing protein n=1 Tax=Rothia endophytica TaxID=1324766 RepID=UPI001F41ECF1|nr:glutaredoxin domain-containing protein [Rothia endophytica]
MNRAVSTHAEAEEFVAKGGVVIYWRPGCPFCQRLDAGLGEMGDRALWVNIWEDADAEAYVKSVNGGNAVVPTVRTSDEIFIASAFSAPKSVSDLIESSVK